jgi:hypothetical protein
VKNLCRWPGSALLAALLTLGNQPAWALRGGQLELKVIDADTGQPVACRVHLKNTARKAQKPPKVPFWHDHFALDGTLLLKLPNGTFVFEIERGPEYKVLTGHFDINENAKDTKTVELHRFVNMSQKGWWSGDFDIARSAKDIELLMRADDLHLAEVVGWGDGKGVPARPDAVAKPLITFDTNHCYHLLAGLEQQPGGSLLLLNLAEPLRGADVAAGGLTGLVLQAREQGHAWVDVRRAASWDLPIWVALGLVDSIELADSQLARLSTKADEAGCRPRDKSLFSSANGIGRWSETVYYHLLNCGLRIPPSAGSGSGVAPNQVGYNRVYVQTGEEFSYDKWFEGLRAGRALVTNGPMIIPTVEGELPGHVFQADAGQEIELEVGLTLLSRDKVTYLEVMKDGRMAHEVRLEEWAKANGKLPPLKFQESGWFLIRAVTDVSQTHRFASTAPYYVEIGYEKRISRASVQFFLDWLDEREQAFKGQKQPDGMPPLVAQARAFWQDLLKKSNAP